MLVPINRHRISINEEIWSNDSGTRHATPYRYFSLRRVGVVELLGDSQKVEMGFISHEYIYKVSIFCILLKSIRKMRPLLVVSGLDQLGSFLAESIVSLSKLWGCQQHSLQQAEMKRQFESFALCMPQLRFSSAPIFFYISTVVLSRTFSKINLFK